MIKVLFVCSGNICRSPTAQGLFEDLLRREGLEGEVRADSAGTHAFYHEGEPPDPRSQERLRERGIDISGWHARMLTPEDCEEYDYILTMDEMNYRMTTGLCGKAGSRAEVRPLLDYSEAPESEVPDPYYGDPRGFERVMELIGEATTGLLADIRERRLEGRV